VIRAVLLSALFAVASDSGVVTLGPVFKQIFTCTEHYAGQFGSLGDALGTDCHIQELATVEGRAWLRSYRTNGATNEDWYGWKREVLAPMDGKVTKVNANPKVNEPGVMGSGVASYVVLAAEDGTMVLLAHIDDVKVKVGDKVSRGQTVAAVGNNGQSRHPHIHVGAWKNNQPLQIRFDQTALAAAYEKPGAQAPASSAR